MVGLAAAVAFLAVAPTIEVSPKVVAIPEPANVIGAAPGADRGERVTVEGKRCGDSSWTVVATVEAETIAGGRWAASFQPTLNGIVRARFRGTLSATRRVQVRPIVNLEVLTRPLFRVEVGVGRYIPSKRVYLERFVAGAWKRVASARLQRDRASFYAISSARLRYRASKGTRVRAVVPGASCYLKGISEVERAD